MLELGSFVAGPFAGQLLGDHGAEVIKIEPPVAGDAMRQWGICQDGRSLWWPAIARNKKSVAVDMRTAEGQQVARDLARHVDIVLENFTPGRLADWGMGYDSLAADNPGLILTHVSGYGQTGPKARTPGFGSVGEAMGGIRHTTGWPDRPSTRAGIALGDQITALFAVTGTLAAVHERARSGLGQEVDVALYEAVYAVMESLVADYELAGHVRGRTGPVLPGVAPSNVYASADGKDIIVAANGDALWRRMAEAMERPELADDVRYATHTARGANQAELDELIAAWTASLPAERILAVLEQHAVPHGLIYTAPDMVDDPHFVARQTIRRIHDDGLGVDVPMPTVVPSLSASPGIIERTGPELGEHTRWALTTVAGYGDDHVAALVEQGVVETWLG